jgi:hypothetical protein
MELFDFYLSEKANTALTGMTFEGKNELSTSVSALLATIFSGKFRRPLGNVS